MICPKCGKEIEEGALFCSYCFSDVRLVPEYEPQVEDHLASTMARVVQTLHRTEKKEERVRRREKELRLIWFGISVLTLVFVLMLFAGFRRRSAREVAASTQEIIGTAAPAEAITPAAEEEAPAEEISAADLLASAEAHLAAEEYDQAKAEAARALQAAPEAEELLSAYRILVKTYVQRQDYEGVARMLAACGNEAVQEKYSEYMVFDPVVDVVSGTYSAPLEVGITAPGNGAIFYTLDGTTPTTSSLLYTSRLTLREGSYELTCVYVNHFGLSSEPKRVQLEITKAQEGQ